MGEHVTTGRSRRILVVDDDRELCDLLVTYLEREDFAVECRHDGKSGLERALAEPADVIILDVMLPQTPGFDVLRRLRRSSSVPVIMLTARGEDVDRIVGLELGADDYLPKPFNPRELVARIQAILRRSTPARAEARAGSAATRVTVALDPPVLIGDLAVDRSRREATFAGRSIPLTTVEFDVLCALVRETGKVVSRQQISQQALGRAHSAYDRSIDMHVMNLRRKLRPVAGKAVQIKTVRSAGYVLVVSPAQAAGAASASPPGSSSEPRERWRSA